MVNLNSSMALFMKISGLLLCSNDILGLNKEFCPVLQTENNVNCGKDMYASNKRYILYDVNPSEGFNLRRDVYVRMAVFIRQLNEVDPIYKWHLVLPPWDHLYHWRSQDIGDQSQIPWGNFYDISSLKKFVPVIELYQFFREYGPKNGDLVLDHVFVLQNDPKMFETNDFRERNEIVPCTENNNCLGKIPKDKYEDRFWGYSNITAKNVSCVIFHGTASNLVHNLEPELYKTFMFHHAEIPLHDSYGSQEFWQARRSMRFHQKLHKIAGEFRKKYLNSTDDEDRTVRPRDWLQEKEQREALGGPYLAIHWRRRDFLIGRSSSTPSIEHTAIQLNKQMENLKLKTIFIATDGDNHEFDELKKRVSKYKVVRYIPTNGVKEELKDGGVAIIDQIICSHARFFIGTYESTFTFRIQEEREIIGFPAVTTFNTLCFENGKCSLQSQWKIHW